MAVDEAGQHHAPPQVDHDGPAADKGVDVAIAAHADDLAVPDGDGRRDGSPAIDRINEAVLQNQAGGGRIILRAGEGRSRLKPLSGMRAEGVSLIFPFIDRLHEAGRILIVMILTVKETGARKDLPIQEWATIP